MRVIPLVVLVMKAEARIEAPFCPGRAFGMLEIGRMHGRFPLFLPLGRRLPAVADRAVATLVDHAMLLLVICVQSGGINTHVSVLHLPIPLGLHKILDFLSAFEVVIGFPMHEAFLSSVSEIVQNKLVHVSIPLVLLVGFPDANGVVSVALVHGRHSPVSAVVIRVFWSAKFGQDLGLDEIAGPDEISQKSRRDLR